MADLRWVRGLQAVSVLWPCLGKRGNGCCWRVVGLACDGVSRRIAKKLRVHAEWRKTDGLDGANGLIPRLQRVLAMQQVGPSRGPATFHPRWPAKVPSCGITTMDWSEDVWCWCCRCCRRRRRAVLDASDEGHVLVCCRMGKPNLSRSSPSSLVGRPLGLLSSHQLRFGIRLTR